jgi:hypothetical protein
MSQYAGKQEIRNKLNKDVPRKQLGIEIELPLRDARRLEQL